VDSLSKKILNMKGLSFAVILAIVLVVVCAIEMSYGYKPGMWRQFKKFDRTLDRSLEHRHRRQFSPNCTKALEEYQTDYFQDCYSTFDKLSDGDLTNQDLDVYCGNRCTSEVIHVEKDLAVYCNGVSYPFVPC